MLLNQSFIIVAHKFLTQPDDDLVIFLNESKAKNVIHIRHSFSDAPDRKSFCTWHKNGKIFKEFSTVNYKKFPEMIIYLKELWFTFKWVMQSGEKWDVYIGMDGLCVFLGNILRFLRKAKRTIFWAVDFVPKDRFESGLKNKIYHFINTQSYRNSDEMWDLSPRMLEAREKFLGIKISDYKKYKIVPYGVWTERIKKYNYNECEKNTLVFMGHLLEKQGVQLIIAVIPEIIKKIPAFRFKIIGEGSFKESLLKLARDLNVFEYCDFKGKIDDIKVLEDEVAKSCVAIAPYIKKLDTWTYYADPGKVKTYLACGVPLLLTNIPWNAYEIEKNKCGIIISEDMDSIMNKIIFLLEEKNNIEYRSNSIRYSSSFNYKNIFKNIT